MSVSVFLSNRSIQVVIGDGKSKRAKIERFFEDDVPEGTLLNGTIINEKALEDTIRGTWSRHNIKERSVDLVLNSPHLMARRIEMPCLSGQKATNYIMNEADEKDIARFSDPVIGWYPLVKNKKTQSVVAETAEKEFIETYVKIFGTVGIKLNSIHNGINLAVNMMQTQVGKGTVVYMILDGMTLTTMLFTGGTYFNNVSTRIDSQPGSAEFAGEIRNAVSSIRQFATAQHIEEQVSDIYVAGLNTDEMTSLVAEMQGYPLADVIKPIVCPPNVSLRSGREKFGSFIFSFAGLFDTVGGHTLLEALKKSSAKYATKKSVLKVVIPYVIVAVILLIVSVSVFVVMIGKAAELAALRRYNSDETVLAAAAEYDEMVLEAERMGRAQGSADLLEEYIDSYPKPDSEVNAAISLAARDENVQVSYDSYFASTGLLNLVATAGTVEKINKFIANLMALDIFENVDYTGYTFNEGSNTWSINVTCTLAPGVDTSAETDAAGENVSAAN